MPVFIRTLQLAFEHLIFFENYVIGALGKLFKGRKFWAKMAISKKGSKFNIQKKAKKSSNIS